MEALNAPENKQPGKALGTCESEKTRVNLSDRERFLSNLTGGALLLYGLRHFRSLKGQLAFLTSAGLIMRGTTGHCHLYKALDVDSSPVGKAEGKGIMDPHPYSINESITVMRSLEECYLFCLDFSNVRQYLPHVENIETISQTHSRLIFTEEGRIVHIPVEVDIAEDQINNIITWQASISAQLSAAGSIQFKEGPKPSQTEIFLHVKINPPVGAVGSAVIKAIGPFSHSLLSHTLHRFKQLIETGEIATTQGQPSGRISKMTLAGLKQQLVHKTRLRTVQGFRERRTS